MDSSGTAASLFQWCRAVARRRIDNLPPARRQRFALVARELARLDDGRCVVVLDAGCGEGLLTVSMARRFPLWRFLGVDLRPDAVKAGARAARSLSLANVSYLRADLTAPFTEPGRFDVVLALEILSEIRDDGSALRNLADVVSPGGLLLLHVPTEDWRPVLPGSAERWRAEVRHGYTQRDLSTALRERGLEIRSVLATQRGVVTVAQEVRDRLKRARAAVLLAVYPAMLAATALESSGLTWGAARGMFIVAQRPSQ